MSSNPRHDAKHTLRCCVSEQMHETNEIYRLKGLLVDAEKRLQRAKDGEIAARQKLMSL